jgi:alkylation response protein AidB-like acyl-CoA dehydrogenase
MEFTLTGEQRLFRDTVYRYGRDEIAPLCEEADLRGEFSLEIWGKLASLGIPGLPFPKNSAGLVPTSSPAAWRGRRSAMPAWTAGTCSHGVHILTCAATTS